jgi:diacylglycerol O-acyltransferase
LSSVDAGFLLAESRETPMHVGGLYLLTLPDGADEQEFLQGALSALRNCETYLRPFAHKLKSSPLGAAGPMSWVDDEHFDVDYHVRHSALPKPGRYRELFALTARLHQSLLDRERPLWEAHIIEGLPKRQFALYSKIHHAAVDGVRAVRLAQSILSPDPDERREYSPFSLHAYQRGKAERASMHPPAPAPSERDIKATLDVVRESFGLSGAVMKSLKRYTRAWLNPGEDSLMTAWSRTPSTSISSKVTGARRFVAQSYSKDRVRAVGRALGGTINDVVLAMCGGALRRYLQARGELPDAPLTAMTPVSLRTSDDDEASNAVGALTANLATHIADPEERYRVTRASMDDGKSLLKGMSPKEVLLFSQITAGPPMLLSMLGLGDKFPPFSTVISNVPGPKTRAYWNGARLDGMYPISAIFHGFALNITLVSNGDQLDFGVVACRRSVPSCQRIIEDLEISLAELEKVAGI